MMAKSCFPLLAAEIGNSRIKLGLFEVAPAAPDQLPAPSRVLRLDTESWEPVEIALWLAPHKPPELRWMIASVRRDASASLMKWLKDENPRIEAFELACENLPLVVDVAEPSKAGMDRLLGAVAANCLRQTGQPAIVIDLGTAITVDVVAADGHFRGGAILPGIDMSARALSEFTDQLPRLSIDVKQPPPALGTSTDEAITSGIVWGAVGALRMLVDQLNEQLETDPLILLTGGGAEGIAKLLNDDVRYEADLLLAGIAIAAATLT